MADSSPRSIGKYEILSVLGKGGMGVVYKGRDPLIDRVVAIKTISSSEYEDDTQLLARLRMEARSAGRLQHPNIVTVFEFGEQEKLAFLVMEYVEGANLQHVIDSGTPLSLNTRLEIITQLCDGIGYAHDLGVVHRDIKPSNICLTLRGDPKILDFGLARFDQTRLTKTGMTSGTLMYMSPERMKGESGPSDDIFALGAVAYEILTGKRAFPGSGYTQIVTNILSGRYPVPPSQVADLPGEIDGVIARATAKDKSQRYASAHELGRALRDIQHSSTFQRRVKRDETSGIASMKTVAVQFAGLNPYTAPEMPQHRTDAHPQATSPAIPSDVATSRHSIVDDATSIRTASFGVEHFAPTEAIVAPDFKHEAATEAVAAPRFTAEAAEPTVAMGAPDFDAVAPTIIEQAPVLTKPARAAAPAAAREVVDAGDDSFIGRTRTVVARALGRKSKTPSSPDMPAPLSAAAIPAAAGAPATTIGSAPDLSVVVAKSRPVVFYLTAVALVLLVGALGVSRQAGTVAFLGTYAAAVAAWFFMVQSTERARLSIVTLIAIAVCVAALLSDAGHFPTEASDLAVGRAVMTSAAGTATPMPAAVPPFASLLFAAWAASGAQLLVRRLVGVGAVLLIGRLLWEPARPRRALGVATFPLLVLEAIVGARIEAVAVLLLTAGVVASNRKKYGWAGLAGITAAGFSVLALTGVPVLYSAAWHMFLFIGAALLAIVLPKLILPASAPWTPAVAALVGTSPVLAFLTGRVTTLLMDWGVISALNTFGAAIAARAGSKAPQVSPEALSTAIVVIALIAVIGMLAARAESAEEGMADAIGVALILFMVREPAAWLLVVPFAIAGNRRFWLLAATCSPLLLFAADANASSALVVWAVSLVVPAAWYLALRLHSGGAKTA